MKNKINDKQINLNGEDTVLKVTEFQKNMGKIELNKIRPINNQNWKMSGNKNNRNKRRYWTAERSESKYG